jgi:hypothetical protein
MAGYLHYVRPAVITNKTLPPWYLYQKLCLLCNPVNALQKKKKKKKFSRQNKLTEFGNQISLHLTIQLLLAS